MWAGVRYEDVEEEEEGDAASAHRMRASARYFENSNAIRAACAARWMKFTATGRAAELVARINAPDFNIEHPEALAIAVEIAASRTLCHVKALDLAAGDIFDHHSVPETWGLPDHLLQPQHTPKE
jgi:hypothetical protein